MWQNQEKNLRKAHRPWFAIDYIHTYIIGHYNPSVRITS